jgi:hypothetical protein
MTLVVIGTRIINGQRFQHGSELPPDLLPHETTDKMLASSSNTTAACDARCMEFSGSSAAQRKANRSHKKKSTPMHSRRKVFSL